jgi:hypothetical protein
MAGRRWSVRNDHPLPLAQPAEAPARQLQPSPLDALLASASERAYDPAERKWLGALLNGERAG